MKKEQKVMINIKSAHFTPSEGYVKNVALVDPFAAELFDSVDAQRIDVDYSGVMSVAGGRLVIRYDESELTGMPGATTEVSFELKNPDIVVMQRSGTVNTSFCFAKDERIECVQDTGDLSLSFVISTDALENAIGENGGDLKISYGMEVRGSVVQRSLMHFHVGIA